MMNLETIQQEIATLPPNAQQIIFDLVKVLQECYLPEKQETFKNLGEDWSDFIGCLEAEPDLSQNYKIYLDKELKEKYDYR